MQKVLEVLEVRDVTYIGLLLVQKTPIRLYSLPSAVDS
jgi:hypothetical protein